jgi:hypothetical protein
MQISPTIKSTQKKLQDVWNMLTLPFRCKICLTLLVGKRCLLYWPIMNDTSSKPRGIFGQQKIREKKGRLTIE